MVANGLLTNPTLFTGSNSTTLDCIQKWVDICFNSTLDIDQFSKLSKNKALIRTIPEKPSNLIFQCFHHHLVFMLEKKLPRKKRQIFNSLQKFCDVLEFLKDEFNVIPQTFNTDDYFKMRSETVDYEGLDKLYCMLKQQYSTDSKEESDSVYDYTKRNGVFFEKKVEEVDNYDLIDLFIENG